MSPIMWMNLYAMFSLTLVVFISMFFFFNSPSSAPTPTQVPLKSSLNWKW